MKKILLLILLVSVHFTYGQSIISVTPNNANRGANLDVTITAQNVDFTLTSDTNRASIIDQFSNILSANYIYTISDTQIIANFTIPSYAVAGQYDLNVYEDFENAFDMTLANGFTVNNTFTYTIQGTIRYDGNNNGCDSSDGNLPFQKLTYTNGSNLGNFFANENGFYSFYDVQVGTNSFSPVMENPSYFTITPPSASVTVSPTNNLIVQDFCVTANGAHNDLEISVFPTTNARPGFDAIYKIVYKNKGTTTQNGTVSFSFNDNVMDFVSAFPTVNNQVVNSLSWNFTNLLPFEKREIYVTMNINSPMETPPVNAGTILNYTATINAATDETPANNSATLNQTVVGSYDPNDKTCVEGTTISPSMVGQYVHYVIRFENTGTANAENVVIRDMIDTSKFDISSLISLDGSANFITRIINSNQVEFIFENIDLPFDDANNDGYVAFKIKTKPTLVLGNTFSNTADIYFDYNFPIVTNTYTTTVSALSNQDFEFSSVFSMSPVPTKNVLTITNKKEIKINAISIYNLLGQLVQNNINPSENIDVSRLSSGNYIIKIVSVKGTTSAKFIKE